jgi:hypothetical protein
MWCKSLARWWVVGWWIQFASQVVGRLLAACHGLGELLHTGTDRGWVAGSRREKKVRACSSVGVVLTCFHWVVWYHGTT